MDPFDINPPPRVSANLVPEVLALAARLQAQQQSAYSLDELVEAGAEANIEPEYIRQAVQQIQASSRPTGLAGLTKRGAIARLGQLFPIAGAIAVAILGLSLIGGPAGMGCHARVDTSESGVFE